MPETTRPLCWLHIGDLHITQAGEQNHADLLRLAALIRRLPPGSLDFVLLPGDNADDGTAAQFDLVRDALADLPHELRILPGDHDFKPRSLADFHRVLGAAPLPARLVRPGYRAVFLDVVSAGTGGPDFRLDTAQLRWLGGEIDAAESAGEQVAVFMHTYPADLRAGADALGPLLARPHVAAVDMGHTHYNELANDGGTIFMATRSTGQIEEGPVGFSVAAIDGSSVAWRFKPLAGAAPFVLITRPADHRLARGGDASGPVRAKVIGDAPVSAVECRADGGAWQAMRAVDGDESLWEGPELSGAAVEVRARDAAGREDTDRVEPPGAFWQPPSRAADGSDADRIPAWPERGILGTQLGPNRNGRKW